MAQLLEYRISDTYQKWNEEHSYRNSLHFIASTLTYEQIKCYFWDRCSSFLETNDLTTTSRERKNTNIMCLNTLRRSKMSTWYQWILECQEPWKMSWLFAATVTQWTFANSEFSQETENQDISQNKRLQLGQAHPYFCSLVRLNDWIGDFRDLKHTAHFTTKWWSYKGMDVEKYMQTSENLRRVFLVS